MVAWHTLLAYFLASFFVGGHEALAVDETPGYQTAKKAEPVPTVPDWLKQYRFETKEFTFARVRYESKQRRARWNVDYPEADRKISKRIRKWTSLKVNENGSVVRLTDTDLGQYPLLYVAEPHGLFLSESEIKSLRQYLTSGGFLMLDDSWGDEELKHVETQLGKVFPERKTVELPLEHAIFHCVFDFKKKPQVYPIFNVVRRRPVTSFDGSDISKVHYRALLDDKKRIIVLMCHNTDLADGWEHSGDDEYYTREFSEKRSFPMGMNIFFYALTGGKPRNVPE